MSLQKQCQQLKSEIYQLKKKARSQQENPLPDHKVLDGIVFGNNPDDKYFRKFNDLPKRLNDDASETLCSNKVPSLATPSEALAYNRFNIKQEIKEIKRLENIPEEFSKSFLHKIKDALHETQTKTPIIKKADEHENSLLKKRLLSMSKTL